MSLKDFLAELSTSFDSTKMMTHTGNRVDPWNPDMTTITIEDIARGLSCETRYGGQRIGFYSVAQHSVLCSEYFVRPKIALAALLHDAEEAYFKDMTNPVKIDYRLSDYRTAAEDLRWKIFRKFGADPAHIKEVDVVDKEMYFREEASFSPFAHELRNDQLITPWTAEAAETAFLLHFKELTT